MRSRLTMLCALGAALAIAGCGGGGDTIGSTLGSGQPSGPSRLLYTGTTSDNGSVKIEATPKLFGSVKMNLDCRDGSNSRVTLTTGPTSPRPTLQPDGSFYYSETGRTTNRQFPGFGAGRYRGAMEGEIVGEKGAGHASFRITFKETSCRSAVKWDVKRGG